jgi:small subunit ribosomal protein S17
MAKKTFVGTIVSDKMQKTVVVEIQRRVQHPVYKKMMKRNTKLKADTNAMEVKVGQLVRIEETRPLSKDKYFKVIEIIEA